MAQVVEMEVDQLRAFDGTFPSGAEVVPGARAEHQPAVLWTTSCEHGVRATVKRDLPALVVLGDVEQDHATGAVDALPSEPKRFTSAKTGKEDELHEVRQVGIP